MLENISIVANNNDVKTVIDVTACSFCPGIVCLDDLDQAPVFLSSSLRRKRYYSSRSSGDGTS
jgi:hypothetical protein